MQRKPIGSESDMAMISNAALDALVAHGCPAKAIVEAMKADRIAEEERAGRETDAIFENLRERQQPLRVVNLIKNPNAGETP